MAAVLPTLDEHVPDLVADILAAAGYDATRARHENLAGVDDDRLLAAAVSEGRALVTFDLDFSDIRRHNPSSTLGIVVLRPCNQSLPSVRAAALALAGLLQSEPLEHRLWILSEDRLRIWPAEHLP